MPHPFLVVNRDLLAQDEPPDYSLRRVKELLNREKELFSPENEPQLVGGRRGMEWEITQVDLQLERLYKDKPEGTSSMWMQAKVWIAEGHGRINERIGLMDEFERLLAEGMEIIRETPGYSTKEKSALTRTLNEPTNRVRSEIWLKYLKQEVTARKKMVDDLRRKQQAKIAFTKSPIHGVVRTVANVFHELGKNDRHEVPLSSGRHGEAVAWTTTRQARRYA